MKFASLRREGVAYASRRAAFAAIEQVERSLREWDMRIDAILGSPALTNASKSFIQDLWYGDPRGLPLSLGNRAVQRASNIASIITLLVHAQNNPSARKGRLRFRMFSTTPDLGITDFEKSTIDLAALSRHFDQAARAADIDALGFIDVAIVDDTSADQGRKIVFHMHGAMRATRKSFRARSAALGASPRRRPRNVLGLKVCKISSKRRDWGRALTRSHVCMLGYYIAKRSCGRKQLYEGRRGRKARTTLHGWTPVELLRQLECYSHCDVLETTRGVSGGKQLRKQWKQIMLRLLKYRNALRGLEIDHESLDQEWARVWQDLGDQHFQPLSTDPGQHLSGPWPDRSRDTTFAEAPRQSQFTDNNSDDSRR